MKPKKKTTSKAELIEIDDLQAEQQLNKCLKKALKGFSPPENLTVSEWADKYRVLPREGAAEGGKWRTSRTPYFKEVMDSFTDPTINRIVVVAAAQVGKALDIKTKIPTPDGWKEMGALKPGDSVFDENGKPCKVVKATEIMYGHDCYEIEFSDGSKIVADADHQWKVDSETSLTPIGGPTKGTFTGVLTTEQMFKDFKVVRPSGKTRNRYSIPTCQPIECEEKELEIKPYTLGVWLGDGHSYSAGFCGHLDDFEIVENIQVDGYSVQVKETPNRNYDAIIHIPWDENFCIHGHDMRIVGKTKKGHCAECSRQYVKRYSFGTPIDPVIKPVEFFTRLKNLGVLKNKHIPQDYLRASKNQRLELLQGLMDTDGYVSKNGRCEITLASKQLIDGVSELLHSLGIKHTLKYKKAKCTSKGYECEKDAYRISFMVYDDMPVFKLKRKLARMVSRNSVGPKGQKRRTTETDNRKIVDIRKVDSVPVRCIEVDSPNHLYLAGPAMIPTHNSEFELNAIGYIIDQDPGPILYIHPNLEEAQKFSTQRFGPMVRDTKVLRRKVSSAKRGDARNTRLQKNFPGGLITMCGTQSPAALASAPMRYVICDERDRWARTTGKEGDPFKLAQARQTTFYNRKTIEVSTPTIKGDSPIAESYELGTKERWCVQCPHCGEWFEITFSQIRFEKKEEEQAGRIVTIVQDGVDAQCPHCGALTSERQIRKQPHKWIAQNPAAAQKGIRSFWLNAFSSPWVSWKSICQEVVDAKNDPEKLKTVYNTKLGELWEDRGDTEDEEFYYDRREDYGKLDNGIPVDVPKGPVLLTMGVDTQDNRLEYEVLGHGHYKETWGIKKGTIMGLPSDSETWRKLDEVLMKDWIRFDGKRMKIAFTCIDSGGHYTPEVYAYCRSRMMYRVFAIKGVGGESVSFTTPYTKQSIGDTRQKVRLYKIGVDAGKAAIMANLRVMAPGPGYCHFPKRPDAGYDMRYFNGLLSERMEFNEKTRKYMWVKIIGHERNEPLDIRNYNLAAFELLHKDTFVAEKELEAMGTEYVSPSPPPKKPPQRKRKGGFDPYGDF